MTMKVLKERWGSDSKVQKAKEIKNATVSGKKVLEPKKELKDDDGDARGEKAM